MSVALSVPHRCRHCRQPTDGASYCPQPACQRRRQTDADYEARRRDDRRKPPRAKDTPEALCLCVCETRLGACPAWAHAKAKDGTRGPCMLCQRCPGFYERDL